MFLSGDKTDGATDGSRIYKCRAWNDRARRLGQLSLGWRMRGLCCWLLECDSDVASSQAHARAKGLMIPFKSDGVCLSDVFAFIFAQLKLPRCPVTLRR